LKNILDYLKKNGEKLDSEIASGIGMSLENTRLHLTTLAAKGEVIMCKVTRYMNDEKIEGMLCRVAGYIPPASPGRKPKAPG
jgi:DNA-binding IclR family transcriptional regulator